jgi:hypothetical protein
LWQEYSTRRRITISKAVAGGGGSLAGLGLGQRAKMGLVVSGHQRIISTT